jgi:hypothetical protein
MMELAAAPHDPSRVDRAAQARFIRRKIELQLKLANSLVQHADESRSALVELELSTDDLA